MSISKRLTMAPFMTALVVAAVVVVGSAGTAMADCTTTSTTVVPVVAGGSATVSNSGSSTLSSSDPLASTSSVGTAASSSLASTGADLPIEVGAAMALALAGAVIVVFTTRRRGGAATGSRTTAHVERGGAQVAATPSSWRSQKMVWRSVAVIGTLAVLTSIFVVRAADPVSAAPRPLSTLSAQLAEDCTTPIVAPADSLPEVPVAAALPVEAALIAAVVIFVTRRRARPRYIPAHASR